MKRFIFLALAWSCLAALAEEISALADRIAQCAEQSPMFGRIDTQIRAAELLMPSEPERAKKFLAAGLDLLRAHPEVRRGAMFAEEDQKEEGRRAQRHCSLAAAATSLGTAARMPAICTAWRIPLDAR